MTDALRIPIDDARCPWCGSAIGEWSVGSPAVCLASKWATADDTTRRACPVDWRGGHVEEWLDGLYLRLDDPRDVSAHTSRIALAAMWRRWTDELIAAGSLRGRVAGLDASLILARESERVALVGRTEAEAHLALADAIRLGQARLLRDGDRMFRACIVVGAAQSLVGLALAAWWPTDPPALAPVALVLGGCVVMVCGGWSAVRRTWTTGAADAAGVSDERT